jgi:hypothetical protein
MDFFARWKNADETIPRLLEAKAEYSAFLPQVDLECECLQGFGHDH